MPCKVTAAVLQLSNEVRAVYQTGTGTRSITRHPREDVSRKREGLESP